ncbi:hypothetical protein I2750_20800, partial [Bacillus sp. PR5]|nr:hypothetical protein [Bacillus sp. PR5]
AVYVMPDSGYALIGTLIDESGNPVADEELRRIVSEPLEQDAWDSLGRRRLNRLVRIEAIVYRHD